MSEAKYNDSVDQGFSRLVEAALFHPVPDMDELRKSKKRYNELPIDTMNPLFVEPLVRLDDYGVAGQSYYSRPNSATGEAVPGVPVTLYIRKSIAETLARINASLADPAITKFFDGNVELYVQDALRPVSLQIKLHDEYIPDLLRKNHPAMREEEIAARLRDIIALPSSDPMKPSPHATGGALDIVLRYKQPNPDFVADCKVPVGHTDSDTSTRINPDYFEKQLPETDLDKLARRNRRAYYAIMTGEAFSFDSGLINNPTEWWHWGRGDQLSEQVRGASVAYYSLAEPPHL